MIVLVLLKKLEKELRAKNYTESLITLGVIRGIVFQQEIGDFPK
jgi:hypothetical protein